MRLKPNEIAAWLVRTAGSSSGRPTRERVNALLVDFDLTVEERSAVVDSILEAVRRCASCLEAKS